MMNSELLFGIANLLYLAGTIFLIRRVIKNKDALKDFDPHGSLINFIGMLINVLALTGLEYYTTVMISTPTMLFWMLVSIYSFKNRRQIYEK